MNDIFEKPETMQENEHPRFYTAESVMRGHPDKLCDLIADSVLDACLQHDPASRVACEVMATHGHIIVAGEITTKVKPDVFNIVRDVLQDVGYDPKAYQIDCYIHDQSPDIAGAVEPELAEGEDEDTLGAGDQGVMVGYACNETPEYLPMPVVAAQRLVTLLEISRMTGVIPDIGPDGKVQVTMEYNGDTPVRIATVVVSVQHKEDADIDKLADLLDEYVFPLAFDGMPADDAEIILNPSGKFVQGGPDADTGLTGRKLMVDSYGTFAPHGGGAFSGKDATKVDRSGAYMARYIAKNMVAAHLADRCQVTLAYAIGEKDPVMVDVNTFGTGGPCEDDCLSAAVRKAYDLTPAGIIKQLNLLNPMYSRTAAGGHFGREDFPWENIEHMEYTVLEQPQPPEQDEPNCAQPKQAEPKREKPVQENPAQLNTKEIKKEETNNVSNPIRAAGQRTEYRALLLKNIEYPILAQNNPMDTMRLDELVELMLDVVCSKRAAIRISGEEMPAEVVKSRFLKLGAEHIQYVLDCLRDNPPRIRNIKQYLLAALYNAPLTIENYYAAQIDHDLCGRN